MPDKTIASLVKYYYSWKKTRSRTSVMDRQEKNKANKDGSENGSENGSNEESDSEEKVRLIFYYYNFFFLQNMANCGGIFLFLRFGFVKFAS